MKQYLVYSCAHFGLLRKLHMDKLDQLDSMNLPLSRVAGHGLAHNASILLTGAIVDYGILQCA